MTTKGLHERIQLFVRRFGLLHQSETPCGQPLSPSQAHALQVLGQTPGLTQQGLAQQLGLDKSTTSRLVGQMAERGWLDRRANPENRREVRLSLTTAGERLRTQLVAAAAGRYEQLLTRIPPEKQAQVLEALDLLNSALGKP